MSKHSYLNDGKSLKYILLFHSATSPRHVFALFHLNQTLKLHVVDPARPRQPLVRLEETYIALHALQKELKNQLSIHDYPESLQTDVIYHGTETAALKAVSRELGLVDNTMTTLVVSSSKEQDRCFGFSLREGMSELYRNTLSGLTTKAVFGSVWAIWPGSSRSLLMRSSMDSIIGVTSFGSAEAMESEEGMPVSDGRTVAQVLPAKSPR
jgi:hypothetical protein